MSEATTTTEATTSAVEAQAVEVTTTEAAVVETTTETPATEPEKFEFPKKFLKPDGTPDHERLAKSYTALEKRFGAKPNMPAASVDEYVWEGEAAADLDPERVSQFKALVHEKGFTKDQYAFVMESHQKVIDELVWSEDKLKAVLQAEWGDDFRTNALHAKRAAELYATSDTDIHDPVFNHPAVMRLLARVGSELGEDSVKPATPSANAGADSIDARIAEIRAKPGWHSDSAAQKELEALYAKKYK